MIAALIRCKSLARGEGDAARGESDEGDAGDRGEGDADAARGEDTDACKMDLGSFRL